MNSGRHELYGECQYKRHATADDRRGPVWRCQKCQKKFCRRHLTDDNVCLNCNLPAASRAALDKPKSVACEGPKGD